MHRLNNLQGIQKETLTLLVPIETCLPSHTSHSHAKVRFLPQECSFTTGTYFLIVVASWSCIVSSFVNYILVANTILLLFNFLQNKTSKTARFLKWQFFIWRRGPGRSQAGWCMRSDNIFIYIWYIFIYVTFLWKIDYLKLDRGLGGTK